MRAGWILAAAAVAAVLAGATALPVAAESGTVDEVVEPTAAPVDAGLEASPAGELAAEEPSLDPADLDTTGLDPADLDTRMDAEAQAMDAEIAADAPPAAADLTGVEQQPARVSRPLGAVGYDAEGRRGRIHIVVPGDTLWDISEAYLGTAWVWPSIWKDNEDIENPHLIYPDDRIWITPYEMRRISEEEAARLLAGEPLDALPPADLDGGEASLDLLEPQEAQTIRVSARETTGLITSEQMESAASIVDTVAPRVMLVQEDQVYIGLGEGDVAVGDQFTVIRTVEKVFDPETGHQLGYHVDLLGWLEVDRVDAESSLSTIRLSAADMQVGDRVIPREPPMLDLEIGPSPDGVNGMISFFPQHRVLMGMIDFVYLNRGELDGLAVGSPLEVYREGWEAPEKARREKVKVEDRVIAQLLVVRARPETSVALVTHTDTELELGDRFRGIEGH